MKDTTTVNERIIKPKNGIAALILFIVLMIAAVAAFIFGIMLIVEGSSGYYQASYNQVTGVTTIVGHGGAVAGGVILVILSVLTWTVVSICFAGLRIVKPNEALVLSLFGKYYGTIYESGFFFVNPFSTAIYPRKRDEDAAKTAVEAAKNNQVQLVRIPKKVSTKLTTFVNGNQKVNDKLGNPVEVSAIVVWKVVNATKAVINVDNYIEYLSSQTDSTIRNIARLYPYDLMSDDDETNDDADETTLRGSATKVAEQMKEELSGRVENAGIEIVEVRLNQIAYATEIAAAMLQRQQAVAIIAARKKIVEGAVSMVEMALDKLKADGVVDLDEERKAQMVSNLLVVLCGNKEANPVLNTGSIY
ncbi:MAG: SPFH domain-containing protein [Spirochaetales bacterium]|nr:SPFH domain-containing protein [Spirochaetales bacterium]